LTLAICGGYISDHVQDAMAAEFGGATLKLYCTGSQAVRESIGHCRADRCRVGTINANLDVRNDRASLRHRVKSSRAHLIQRWVGINLRIDPSLIKAGRFGD
jgi:hypothetical protein